MSVTVVGKWTAFISSHQTRMYFLLVNRYSQLCPNTVFVTGRGLLRREIQLKNIYDSIGKDKADALLGFHAFTGADTSGRFAGKTKKTAFKIFMSSPQDVLRAFQCLGKGITLPSEETVTALEKFVCSLYCPKSSGIVTIPQCRWYLFSQKHAERGKAPTDSGNLARTHTQGPLYQYDLGNS